MPNKYQATPLWETSAFKKLFGSSSNATKSKPFYTEENFPMMTSISNGVRNYGSKLQDAILQSGLNTGKTGFNSGMQSYTAGTAPVNTDIQAPIVPLKTPKVSQKTPTVDIPKKPIAGTSFSATDKSKKTAFDTTTGANATTAIDQPLSDMGWGTKQDIINYQKANGLVPDGIVGPKTIAAMNANPPSIYDAGNASIHQQAESRMHQTGNGNWGYGVPDYNSSSNGGNNESSFLGSLFSQPSPGENGWFSKGKQGLNESDVAYAARLQAPTSFMNTLSGIGTGVSALGGLYNMYQTGKNYDLEKQANEQKMALARASEANRSAMAKAFGSTYTPAQF